MRASNNHLVESRAPANGTRSRPTLACFAPSEMSDWVTNSPTTDTAIVTIDKAGEGVRLRWQPLRIAGKNKATRGAINGRRMLASPANCQKTPHRLGHVGKCSFSTSVILDILQPQSRVGLQFLVQRDVLLHDSFLNFRTHPN
jgi:hypothetical protein